MAPLGQFSAQILQWDGEQMPPPQEMLETFAREAIEANRTKTIGRAAKRLNYQAFRQVLRAVQSADRKQKQARKPGSCQRLFFFGRDPETFRRR